MSISQKILPRHAIGDMIEEAGVTPGIRGIRNRLIIALMGRCALRSIEVRNLKPFNVKTDEDGTTWLHLTRVKRTVKRNGMLVGRKRSIPVPDDVAAWLHDWLDCDWPGGDYIFPNAYGNPLSKPTIWRIVTNTALDAGYPDVHPHMLRHTCISDWMQSGVFSAHGVMAMSGHKNTVQLDVYLHARPEDLAAGMRQVSAVQ